MKFHLVLASTLFVSPPLIDAGCANDGEYCYDLHPCCSTSSYCHVNNNPHAGNHCIPREAADKDMDIPARCLDEKYEVYLHAVKGPHFALGVEATQNDKANCPFAFAFNAANGKKTINMYESKNEVPDTTSKIKLGNARLNDILLAEGSLRDFFYV